MDPCAFSNNVHKIVQAQGVANGLADAEWDDTKSSAIFD
jgi:hypothetical protein